MAIFDLVLSDKTKEENQVWQVPSLEPRPKKTPEEKEKKKNHHRNTKKRDFILD